MNLSEIEKENTAELNRFVEQIQFNLNYALSATNTLAFIVENYGIPEEFDSIAKKLISANDLIDGIQLLENGVITKMYPLEGNEVVIGYDVVADHTRGREVIIAAEKGQMYFAGPFELRQGGLGIVGRTPIKVEHDSLAFAAVVIKLEKLLQVGGIAENREHFDYQLSKINPDTNEVEYFLESDFDIEKSQVASINVPLGEWQIYVKEKHSNYYSGVFQLSIFGIVLAFFGAFLTRIILKRPAELEKQVNVQTELIFSKEKRFRALVEKSSDVFNIIDAEGMPIYVSPAITSVLGYTEAEAYRRNFLNLVHPEDFPVAQKSMSEVLNSPGIPIKTKPFRGLHKNGNWRWIESTATNYLEDPDIKGIVTNFRDITASKESEEAILREKELSEAIINSLPGIFYLFNQEGRYLMWNQNLEEVSGYTCAEIQKMTPSEFFADEDLPYITGRIQEVFEKGESDAETYLYTKNKEKIYYYFTGKTILYKNEVCLLGCGIDLSKRHEAELELKRSEEQLLSIFNNSISAVILMDADGLINSWNPKATEIFGWKAAEVINKPMHHFIIPEEHLERHLKGMEHYKKTGKGSIINSNIEITAKRKDQQIIDISLGVTTVTIRGNEFFIGFMDDITERKQIERINAFEQRNRDALINSTKDLIWSVSKDMTLIAANEAFKESFKKYTGVSNVSKGDNMLPSQLDKDFAMFWKGLYNRALGGETFTNVNVVPENENQEGQAFETSFSPIVIEERIEGVACSARNITDRIKNQEEIKEYNEKLKTAQEIAKLGYWEFDYKNDKLTWSDQVYKIWELPKKNFKISFESFFNSIHPDDQERFNLEQEKALKGEKPLDIEHRIVLNNGKTKWVLERGKLIKDKNGKPMLFEGTVQDITAQKQIEIELREQNNFIKTAIDNLPLGIAVRDIHTGKFTLMNKNFTQIYGWSQREIRDADSFFDMVYPDADYRKKIKEQVFSDLASKDIKRMQWEGIQVTTKKGDKRMVNSKNIPLYEQNLMISTVLDVTEKYLAEQQLALSIERYEYITKATFDAIWDWDLDKQSIFWGEGFKTLFGHNVENTNFDFWLENVHPDDAQEVLASIDEALLSNVFNWESEYRFKHSNGTYRYVKDRGVILRNIERKAIRFIGAIQDITQQKEYEQKLLDVNQKLRNLSAYLQEAREEERISIAREIHDELGQQLTGIKLDASWLKNKIIKHLPEDTERLERLIGSINKAINDVRKVASNLRPGVLDDLGLEAAIEWQSQLFEEQTGIKTTLITQKLSDKYEKDINTAFYRIYQESLTNIMRHAKATEVKTTLSEENNTLKLEIEDNGIGIDESDKNNTFSLGITGMRERALMINGTFSIENQKKGGTKVKVLVSLED